MELIRLCPGVVPVGIRFLTLVRHGLAWEDQVTFVEETNLFLKFAVAKGLRWRVQKNTALERTCSQGYDMRKAGVCGRRVWHGEGQEQSDAVLQVVTS